MAVFKRKDSDNWWYRFRWHGEEVRVSTKQSNKRVAEQMEATHKARLAKGEVGIMERRAVPTLAKFAECDFLPFVRSQFAEKPNTVAYYAWGVKVLSDSQLGGLPLDRITPETIGGFVAKAREAGLMVATMNRQLQILRRILRLAVEWGRMDRTITVRLLPGERRRERVLSPQEEAAYLRAATDLGTSIEESYAAALEGIRCVLRGQQPHQPDAYLLRDVATILIDCGLRPEECNRLRWEHVRDGAVHIPHGKTANARRRIPLSKRASAILDMRRTLSTSEWVFPAATRSGHIEPSSLKKQHAKACEQAGIERFALYTLRHTCLTRWAAHMDPFSLAHLAGHSDFATTRRYVHPQTDTVLRAIERAREAQGGHDSGHSAEMPS
jgi:integrase